MNAIGWPGPNITVVNMATVDIGIDLKKLVQLGMDYLYSVVVPHWPGKQATLIAATQLLPRTQAILLMDDADQADALGYHDVTPEGYPITKVFVKTSLADGASMTEVFTHELAEMRGDPDCNLCATDAAGTVWALELADAVEEELFSLDGYPVSNIVTMAYFEPFHNAGTVKFDHLGKLSKPFEIAPGGYGIYLDLQKGWQEKFGSLAKSERFAREDRRLHRSELRKARYHLALTKGHPEYVAASGRRPVMIKH